MRFRNLALPGLVWIGLCFAAPFAHGTIDEDYRGEVKVALVNLGPEPFVVEPGSRVGQLIVAPITRVDVEAVDRLAETSRGGGGFGHTGE